MSGYVYKSLNVSREIPTKVSTPTIPENVPIVWV